MTSELTRAVLDRHILAWRQGNVPGLLADYADDAVMLHAVLGVVAGKEAIGAMFEGVFAELLPPAKTELTIESLVVAADGALMHYVARSPAVTVRGAFDAFTLREGKIALQFSGGDIVPNA